MIRVGRTESMASRTPPLLLQQQQAPRPRQRQRQQRQVQPAPCGAFLVALPLALPRPMSMAAAAATPGRLGPMVGRPSLQGPAFIVKSEYDKNDFRNTRPSVESTFRPSRMVRPPAPSAPPADGRFPAGKLPFAFEIDFVLNHPIADAVIAALVSVNCLIFPLQTIDVGPALHTAFLAYEHNLSILFLLEYFGRWYGKGLSPRFLLTRGMLVDFLAVAPFGFVVVDQSEALFVRILRLSRILRIQRVMMDTDRSAEMMGSLTNIQVQLANIGLSLFSLLYVSAGLFYTVEKDVNPTVLNFFDAFYFSTVTLFTVGFGDVTPLTSMGRTITVLTVLSGAVLVPYQLSEIERVRRMTTQSKPEEAGSGGGGGADRASTGQQVMSGQSMSQLAPSKRLYSSVNDKYVQCKRCFLRGHQVDARFCRNCGAQLDSF